MEENRNIALIVLEGPTASGKTELSVKLAKRFDAEILSFDSMQLYKGADIACAKPSAELLEAVPHHMISVAERENPFSVAEYKKCADRIIREIHGRGKRVLAVGGTGLYIDAVVRNLSFPKEQRDEGLRRELEAELSQKGASFMFEKLRKADPKAAEELHENDRGRVLRALELYMLTGSTRSERLEKSKKIKSPYEPLYIFLSFRDREKLYERINERTERMLKQGLLSEARELIYAFSDSATSSQLIGAKEFAPYFRGEAALDECVERLKMDTRRYAKRQLTWFSANTEAHRFFVDELGSEELFEETSKLISAFLSNFNRKGGSEG